MDNLPPPDTSNIGKVMSFAAWALVILLFAFFFSQWSEPTSSEVKVLTHQGKEKTIIQRNQRNQYAAKGMINGKPVIFLVDTGATDVVVPAHLAKTLGLELGPEARAKTAGGDIKIHQTRIKSLIIGNIELRNIGGSINPVAHSDQVLLGMSALKHMRFHQEGEKMVLEQKPLDP